MALNLHPQASKPKDITSALHKTRGLKRTSNLLNSSPQPPIQKTNQSTMSETLTHQKLFSPSKSSSAIFHIYEKFIGVDIKEF
ncbi:hypothetical protein HHE06_09240 [Helicobacter heilmannii]|nr:hypothetical protein HHE06_09240 [Helicobacter heilmannii]